jgi:hypothetical protein
MNTYDNYEISPCRRFEEPDTPGKFYFEVCEPAEADVWTLYGHIDGEGVEAIGDFSTRKAAEQVYSRITGQPFTGSYQASAHLKVMHAGPKLLAAAQAAWQRAANHEKLTMEECNLLRVAIADATFDTGAFPCHCPAPTGKSPAKEAEQGMTRPNFTGDDWVCGCGNQPHLDGFQPCLKTGKLVEPTPAAWTDGELYRCMRCNSIIAWDSSRDRGRIAGTTAPGLLARTGPEMP